MSLCGLSFQSNSKKEPASQRSVETEFWAKRSSGSKTWNADDLSSWNWSPENKSYMNLQRGLIMKVLGGLNEECWFYSKHAEISSNVLIWKWYDLVIPTLTSSWSLTRPLQNILIAPFSHIPQHFPWFQPYEYLVSWKHACVIFLIWNVTSWRAETYICGSLRTSTVPRKHLGLD